MTTSIAAMVLAAGVAPGCSVSTNDEPVAVRGPFDRLVESTTTTSPTTAPVGGTRIVEVYFLRTTGGSPKLVPVEREVPADAGLQQVLTNLFDTPPDAGQSGVRTAIIESAALLGVTPGADGQLVVDTQGLFGEEGVQNPELQRALGQIVCTATELPSVESVLFRNEGRPVGAAIENGNSVDRPVDCSDYDDLS